ncbi:MAG: hypothetical protein U0787_07045 [Polyangia bacterium]
MLDAQNAYRKYVDGTENSGLRVANCFVPKLSVEPGSLQITRPSAGHGEVIAKLKVQSPSHAMTPGVCQIQSQALQTRFTCADLFRRCHRSNSPVPGRQSAELHLRDLADGKYLVSLTPSAGGKNGESLLLPLWIEPEPFRFSDTPLYMAMTDRFVDGDGINPGQIGG